MVVQVLKVAGGADTEEQGSSLWSAITHALATSPSSVAIEISFAGVDTATSSFVNASLVRLLDAYTFDEIKRRIKVVHSTRQINDMIKRRLSQEALAAA